MGHKTAKAVSRTHMGYGLIDDNKILAVIPAREGSKGIRDKNIYPLCGKPLIAFSIESAKNSQFIDEIVVSTDSERIAAIAKEFGASVPFLRPKELATDTSKTIDAIIYTITELKKRGADYDILILLQPTSPLRTTEDIDGALKEFIKNNKQPLASISEVNDHPILMRALDNDGTLKNLLDVNSSVRRQDMPKIYRVNGSIYINCIADINTSTSFNDNKIPYITTQNHSVDIDDEKDFILAEYYIKKRII